MPQTQSEIYRRWRLKNVEACRERCRVWYRQNKKAYNDRRKPAKLAIYALKKDVLLAKTKEWRIRNQERSRAQQREYRLRNLDKKRQQVREWHKAHRNDPRFKKGRLIRWRENEQKRRALKRAATINLRHIKAWMHSILSKPAAICYWHEGVIPISKVHFDHIIPLKEGGAHSIENLCVSCDACNLKKGAMPLRLWIKMSDQQMLEL